MSVHKTKNGTWRVKWRDQYGAQLTKTFKRKGDADDHDRKIHLGHIERESPRTRLTFAEFSKLWLKDHADVHHEKGTKINVDGYIRNWFTPAFGKKHLSDIRHTDFVTLQRKIVIDEGRSEKTANNIILAAKKMFSDAVKWKLVRENPAADVELMEVQATEKEHWTRVEMNRFLKFCRSRNPQIYEAVLLTVKTGLRRGELKGLKRDCVDFERGLIQVKRTYDQKIGDIKPYTKGKRLRYVPMTPEVSAILSDRKLLAPDQYMLPYELMSIVRDPYEDMCKAAGVKRITWHRLRDTYGSHLSESGLPQYQIQRLMGHASGKTTEGYMHLNPRFFIGVVEALETGSYNPMTTEKAEREEPETDVPFLFRLPESH